MTEPNRMLAYWIQDKGIETAIEDYFPHLLKDDREIREYYAGYQLYKNLLLKKAQEFSDNYDGDYDD